MTRQELKELFEMVWDHDMDPKEAMEHFMEEAGIPVCENCGETLEGHIVKPDED